MQLYRTVKTTDRAAAAPSGEQYIPSYIFYVLKNFSDEYRNIYSYATILFITVL